MDIDEAVEELGANTAIGLMDDEAALRLAQDGENILKKPKEKTLLSKIAGQFKNIPLLLLIAAAVLSAVFNDGLAEAIVIVVLLIIMVIVSVRGSNRTGKVLRELDNAAGLKARVMRSGQMQNIDVINVVRGDVVFFRKGDYIPADIRLIESNSLKIDEAAITGESEPASKDATIVLDSGTLINDRCNLGFMGSYVACGRGAGVVCATGMDTEMGKNAITASAVDNVSTPLQDKLTSAVKTLSILFMSICALTLAAGVLYDIFGIGTRRGYFEVVTMALALAVVAVPRGITYGASLIMANGVHNLIRSNVLVKNFRTALNVGYTTMICTDKTGILTQNRMTVTRVADCENVYEVTGVGYKDKGHVVAEIMITRNIALMSEIVVLCNDASYDRKHAQISGDPTEGAMLVFGVKLGHEKEILESIRPRIHEIPFDSDRRMMSTYNMDGERVIMYTKGAAEEIIKHSSYVYLDGEIVSMTDAKRATLTAQCGDFASQGLRVLACAYKVYNSSEDIDDSEDDLIYVGMMGMTDPVRGEIAGNVKHCRSAGIGIKMITGEHKNTALVIAQVLGIADSGGAVMTGEEIDELDYDELCKKIRTVNVFARAAPRHKLRIVETLETMSYDMHKGENTGSSYSTIAVIGSGTDDLPALRKADVAIAMGNSGKDAARDVADVIIADDDFSRIVNAIEQGRTIYTNIRKTTNYVLVFSISLALLVFTVLITGLPIPLSAAQLLFACMLINTLPVFAIGRERMEHRTIARRPRNPEEAILNRKVLRSSFTRAFILYFCSLAAFLYGYFIALSFESEARHILAMSMCFFTFMFGALFATYSIKTNSYMASSGTLLRNSYLNISSILIIAVVTAIEYIPGVNDLLMLMPLSIDNIFISAVLIFLSLLGIELSKFGNRR